MGWFCKEMTMCHNLTWKLMNFSLEEVSRPPRLQFDDDMAHYLLKSKVSVFFLFYFFYVFRY